MYVYTCIALLQVYFEPSTLNPIRLAVETVGRCIGRCCETTVSAGASSP